MATPNANSLSVTTFTPSAAQGAGWQLLFGSKWGGALGAGATITYSFPNLGAWSSNYGAFDDPEHESMLGFIAAEIAGTKAALAEWAKVANLKFTAVSDTESTVGEIRFAYSDRVADESAAHAYFPHSSPSGGDAWFNPDHWNSNGGSIPKGSFDFLTILHELGHSLGLEHSFGGTPLPDKLDNFFYSIMSYTASPWSADANNYASFYPTTPMYYDLLAIQTLYGKNTTINQTNTVYTFKDGVTYFQTINDAGGNDTIVYSGVEGSTINLNAGAFSQLSERIYFSGGSSRGTVAIGPGVVIENASGGFGHDTLTGNALANKLFGNRGNDIIRGNNGNDYIVGGLGNDTLTGGVGADMFVFNTALSPSANRDTITDFTVADDTMRLENSIFGKLFLTGSLPSIWFKKGLGATDVNDYIIYSPSSGYVLYDTNGSGVGGATVFAKLATGLAITAADFFVV